jgi:hypothetical protein
VLQTISYDAVDNDVYGFFTNASTITVPAGMAGLYLVGTTLRWGPESNGNRALRIYLNQALVIAEAYADSVNNLIQECSTVFALAAGDTIRVAVLSSVNATLSLAVPVHPAVWLTRLGNVN